MINDEGRVESAEDRRGVEEDNHSLEDKDENVIILAKNNMHMVVDPRMKLPEPPPEWVPSLPKVGKEAMFSADVDDPGEWHEFTYTAKMEKGKYRHHCIPTGAIPVTPDKHGKREVNEWKFNYQGWSGDK
jgi:hypothetical protein